MFAKINVRRPTAMSSDLGAAAPPLRTFALLAIVVLGLSLSVGAAGAQANPGPVLGFASDGMTVMNVGDEAAYIRNVELIAGDLVWAGTRDPDGCSIMGTVYPGGDGCELHLEGAWGIVRFTIDGYASQELEVGEEPVTLPDPDPPVEPDPPVSGSSLVTVNGDASFHGGQLTIIDAQAAPTDVIERVEILSGDLEWAASATPENCSGHVLREHLDSCSLLLTGTTGTLRFFYGSGPHQDLEVSLGAYPPVPPGVPDPEVDPYLQISADSVWMTGSDFSNLLIENVGAAPAVIESIEFVHGDIDEAGHDPDECSGVTLEGGTCPLRLTGSGVMRFHLAGGHTQDVRLNPGALFAIPWPDETASEERPSVTIFERHGGVIASALSNGTTTLGTNTIDFNVYAQDDSHVVSIKLFMDGQLIGTQRPCDVGNASCAPLACHAILKSNPGGSCEGWPESYRGSANVIFEINTALYADGKHTVTAVATTITGNQTSSAPWNFVIDNNPPLVAVAGGLYNASGRDRLASGSLHILATDNGSGVHTIDLWEVITGGTNVLLAHKDQPCDVVCVPTTLTADFTINPIGLGWADGIHHLLVEAKDMAGFPTPTSWDITFYKAAWFYGGLDDQRDFDWLADDLATRPDFQAIWDMLRQTDKNRLMWDTANPRYDQWASRIDEPGFYWSSWKYGGAEHSVNTNTKRSALAPVIEQASDDMNGRLWDGLTPPNQGDMYRYLEDDYSVPGPGPATKDQLAAQYMPLVMQDSQDGFYPISFRWVGGMKGGNYPPKRGCIRVIGDSDCFKRIRNPINLPAATGTNMYLDFPSDDDRSDVRSVTNKALQAGGVGEGWPNRQNNDAAQAVYYYVGAPNPDPGPKHGEFLIQYWYFWAYNYFDASPLGDLGTHEGDWEHVDIRFNQNNEPIRVTMSRHEDGDYTRRLWSEMEKVSWLNSPDDMDRHIVVYAAHGSHAFYHKCDDFLLPDLRAGTLGRQYDTTCWSEDGAVLVGTAGQDARLIPLPNVAKTFACWQGKLGKSSAAPLRATTAARGAKELCDWAAGSGPIVWSQGDGDSDDEGSVGEETYEDSDSHCSGYDQPPGSGDWIVIACDQRDLPNAVGNDDPEPSVSFVEAHSGDPLGGDDAPAIFEGSDLSDIQLRARPGSDVRIFISHVDPSHVRQGHFSEIRSSNESIYTLDLDDDQWSVLGDAGQTLQTIVPDETVGP